MHELTLADTDDMLSVGDLEFLAAMVVGDQLALAFQVLDTVGNNTGRKLLQMDLRAPNDLSRIFNTDLVRAQSSLLCRCCVSVCCAGSCASWLNHLLALSCAVYGHLAAGLPCRHPRGAR